MCENKSHPPIPAGWLLLFPWALCEQLSPWSPAGPSLPGGSSSVFAQLQSVPAPGPHLARVGDVPRFRRTMQRAPAAGQPSAKFGCICEVQHNTSATAECVLQGKGKAWWENRAAFQSNDKCADACMAQIPERLEESLKWKELFFYVAKKIEHYFGGMRRNVIRA